MLPRLRFIALLGACAVLAFSACGPDQSDILTVRDPGFEGPLQSLLTISDFSEYPSRLGEGAAAYIDTTLRRQRFPSEATYVVHGRPDPLLDADDAPADSAAQIDGLRFSYQEYARSLNVTSVLLLRETSIEKLRGRTFTQRDAIDGEIITPGQADLDAVNVEASVFDLVSGKRIWRATTQIPFDKVGRRSAGRDFGRFLLVKMREDGLFPSGMRSHFSSNLPGR